EEYTSEHSHRGSPNNSAAEQEHSGIADRRQASKRNKHLEDIDLVEQSGPPVEPVWIEPWKVNLVGGPDSRILIGVERLVDVVAVWQAPTESPKDQRRSQQIGWPDRTQAFGQHAPYGNNSESPGMILRHEPDVFPAPPDRCMPGCDGYSFQRLILRVNRSMLLDGSAKDKVSPI